MKPHVCVFTCKIGVELIVLNTFKTHTMSLVTYSMISLNIPFFVRRVDPNIRVFSDIPFRIFPMKFPFIGGGLWKVTLTRETRIETDFVYIKVFLRLLDRPENKFTRLSFVPHLVPRIRNLYKDSNSILETNRVHYRTWEECRK